MRGSGRRAKAGSSLDIGAPGADIDSPALSIEQAIENERRRLTRAQAILTCLHSALVQAEENEDCNPAYAEAADLVTKLIRESVDRLDSVYIKPLIAGIGRGGGRAGDGKPASPASRSGKGDAPRL